MSPPLRRYSLCSHGTTFSCAIYAWRVRRRGVTRHGAMRERSTSPRSLYEAQVYIPHHAACASQPRRALMFAYERQILADDAPALTPIALTRPCADTFTSAVRRRPNASRGAMPRCARRCEQNFTARAFHCLMLPFPRYASPAMTSPSCAALPGVIILRAKPEAARAINWKILRTQRARR